MDDPTEFRIGFELTFIPYRPRSRWQEWRSARVAKSKEKTFNALLEKSPAYIASSLGGVTLWAKADIFRSKTLSPDKQPHDAWCLEVNNTPMSSKDILSRVPSPYSPYALLKEAYSTAAHMGLRPHVEHRKRDGTLVDYPNGGGHQHIQIDFWPEGAQYLLKLYTLERSLCIDYANNPIIRWFFAHWNDNLNSNVAVNASDLRYIQRVIRKLPENKKINWEESGLDTYIHDRALSCHSIKQRIACTGKPVRPTLEFRFLDRPRDVDELVLHTRFITAWVDYHIERINRNTGDEGASLDTLMPRFTLTPYRYERFTKDAGFASRVMEDFLLKLGLDAETYLEAFWDRGYKRRKNFGKFA